MSAFELPRMVRPGLAEISRIFLICLMLASGMPAVALQAQSVESTGAMERQVKAAYLYKFASYIEWPEGTFAAADSALVIGVAGADALSEELERLVAGRTINGRAMTVRRIRRGEPIAGIHILFLGRIEKAALQEFIGMAKGLPTLTVSESEEAHALGSMINFRLAEERMRFEVALKPVAQSRLKISARMLAVAYKVDAGAL